MHWYLALTDRWMFWCLRNPSTLLKYFEQILQGTPFAATLPSPVLKLMFWVLSLDLSTLTFAFSLDSLVSPLVSSLPSWKTTFNLGPTYWISSSALISKSSSGMFSNSYRLSEDCIVLMVMLWLMRVNSAPMLMVFQFINQIPWEYICDRCALSRA